MVRKKCQTTNMFHSKKLENVLESHPGLLEIGIKKVKSELLELHPEHECLIKATYKNILNNIKLYKKLKLPYAMPELAVELKLETLNDKSIFLDKDILKQKWLQMSVLVLNGKEKDYLPFWTEQSKVNSERLYLPTETDYVDLHSSSLNTCLPFAESKLPLSITTNQHPQMLNSQTISCPLYTSILADKWVKDDTKQKLLKLKNKQENKQSQQPDPTGIIKIRILPTKKQQQVFKRWLGSYNYTWNKTLQYIKDNKIFKPKYVSLKNKFTVLNPNHLMGQTNPDVPLFMAFTSSKIRARAVQNLCTVYTSAQSNLERGNIAGFNIKPKCKKNQTRCFSLPIPKDGISFTEDANQRKTHISIFPDVMKHCFGNVKPKATSKNQTIKSHLDYKKRVGSNEMYQEYLSFMVSCGVPITLRDEILRKHYQSSSGLDVWNDYFDYMMYNGFHENIDSDYKLVYKNNNEKVAKPKLEVKPSNSTLIRFYHRKNDKLLYNLSANYDCTLKYEYGSWYMIIPYIRKPKYEPEQRNTIVGLDPGIKTFQTFFSENMHGKLQQTTKFKTIRHVLDRYHELYKNKKIKYCKFKFKTNQLYRKQSNLARQIHYETINFLTSRYNWVLLPSFNTHDMVRGYGMSKETKRETSQLQHYKFQQRLLSHCASMKNCKVLIVSEAYTSKTCGRCGHLKNNLTLKDRIYKCSHCGLHIDRDINGSRNVVLRNIQTDCL